MIESLLSRSLLYMLIAYAVFGWVLAAFHTCYMDIFTFYVLVSLNKHNFNVISLLLFRRKFIFILRLCGNWSVFFRCTRCCSCLYKMRATRTIMKKVCSFSELKQNYFTFCFFFIKKNYIYFFVFSVDVVL